MSWLWIPEERGAALDVLRTCRRVTQTIVGRGARPCSAPALILIDVRRRSPEEWSVTLDRVRASFPGTSTVLLADFARHTIRRLVDLPSDVQVIWDDEPDRLRHVVSRAVRASLPTRVAAILTSADNEHPLVLRAVERALLQPSPPRTVARLARQLWVSERGLRAAWHRSNMPGSPKDLTDWRLVCAMAEAREAGHSIEALARRIGVDESTLYRVSRRVLMRGPADVTEEAILEAAREWMTPRRSE